MRFSKLPLTPFLSLTLITLIGGCSSSNSTEACFVFVGRLNDCLATDAQLDIERICDKNTGFLKDATKEQRECARNYYDCASIFLQCSEESEPMLSPDNTCEPCPGLAISPESPKEELLLFTTLAGGTEECQEASTIVSCPAAQCSEFRCDDGFVIDSQSSTCADTGLAPTECETFSCPLDAPSECIESSCSLGSVEAFNTCP